MEFVLKFVGIDKEITIKDPQIKDISSNHFVVYKCGQEEFDKITQYTKKSPTVKFKINDEEKHGAVTGLPYDYQNKELKIKLLGVGMS